MRSGARPGTRPAAAIRRVAITQPYVPQYRVPLFDHLIGRLTEAGLGAHVFYGGDATQMRLRRERGDMVEVPWASEVRTRTLRVAGTHQKFVHRVLPAPWSSGTLLLTEMQAGNANALLAAIGGRRFVTMGHGSAYTADENPVALRMESWLNSRAAHVLTYTEAGRRAVLERTRRDVDDVTSFNNATDTTALRRAVESLDAVELAEYRRRIGVPDDAVPALVLGALNAHKLPEQLIEAATAVFEREPRAWLVVAGDGPEMPAFRRLADRTGRVTLLGQIGTADIASAAGICRFLVNPGRIGLVAVDALALGLPILTTTAARHAPEAEYLTEGIDVITVDGPAALSERWLTLVDVGAGKGRPADNGGITPRPVPTIEAAADRIADALLAAAGGQR